MNDRACAIEFFPISDLHRYESAFFAWSITSFGTCVTEKHDRYEAEQLMVSGPGIHQRFRRMPTHSCSPKIEVRIERINREVESSVTCFWKNGNLPRAKCRKASSMDALWSPDDLLSQSVSGGEGAVSRRYLSP